MNLSFKNAPIPYDLVKHTHEENQREEVVQEEDDTIKETLNKITQNFSNILNLMKNGDPHELKDNLKGIIRLIDKKNKKLCSSILEVFSQINFGKFLCDLFNENQYEFEVDIIEGILFCIAKLIDFPEYQSLFIENGFLQIAASCITHEESNISLEALHVVSKLMEYAIKHNITFDNEFFIYNVCDAMFLSIKHELYSIRILMNTIHYSNNESLIRQILPQIKEQYKEHKIHENDIFEYDYEKKILLMIFKSFYYTLKFNYNSIIDLQNVLSDAFSRVKFLSPTKKMDQPIIAILFKTLYFIINHDPEAALKMIQLIQLEKFYFFIQDSDFVVVLWVLNVLTFAVVNGPKEYYDFCINKEIVKLLLSYLTDEAAPFLVKHSTLTFIHIMLQNPDPQSVYSLLIRDDFIVECSDYLDADDVDVIRKYFEIIDIMLQYSTKLGKNYTEIIVSEIIDSNVGQAMNRIIHESPCILPEEDVILGTKILHFCEEFREAQENEI
ncbi:hypothetical protein TRFO_19529 [Tritrichomonas foetus]|uniref:SPIN90/Ldb17 leucine-rich domain-containing protein n=1 Tax=Tritrichomonas foetus TaxID=1144522 RepID=A0A1J4KNI2_9EUKA|nr:hypothetical protein TRFO_19529 [Tritrichomonas foetus]|eukprot:OHT10957.1 hypothetical protein TRFO_19529 [Tritrichomonas foetus]